MSGFLSSGINIVISILGIITIGLIFAIISNSTIDRIPKNQSIINPGPYCKTCAAKLFWKDLIPIWSYFHSKGKCPYCSDPIPQRNLIVDFAQVGWVAIYITLLGWSYQAVLEMVFGMALIAIIVIEKENRRLSDLILLLLGMLSVIYLLSFQPSNFPMSVIAFLVGGIILGLYNGLKILTRTKSHIDIAEIKFGAILGLFLGISQIVLCVFVALLIGAIGGSFRIKFMAKDYYSVVPEFPLLMAVAGLITILFGQEMLILYHIGVD